MFNCRHCRFYVVSVQTKFSDESVNGAVLEPALDELVYLGGKRRILLGGNAVFLRRECVCDVIAVVRLVCRQDGLIDAESVNRAGGQCIGDSRVVAELLE